MNDIADPSRAPAAPRWAKAFGLVAAVVVLVFLVLLLAGGGDHGPGRHLDGGGQPGSGVEHDAPHP